MEALTEWVLTMIGQCILLSKLVTSLCEIKADGIRYGKASLPTAKTNETLQFYFTIVWEGRASKAPLPRDQSLCAEQKHKKAPQFL